MPLSKVANGTAAKGQWTKVWTTTAANQEIVLRITSLSLTRPVPSFSWAYRYNDVLNTSEPIYVKSLGSGNRNTYYLSTEAGEDLWLYHELRSPLPNPCLWEVWRYS